MKMSRPLPYFCLTHGPFRFESSARHLIENHLLLLSVPQGDPSLVQTLTLCVLTTLFSIHGPVGCVSGTRGRRRQYRTWERIFVKPCHSRWSGRLVTVVSNELLPLNSKGQSFTLRLAQYSSPVVRVMSQCLEHFLHRSHCLWQNLNMGRLPRRRLAWARSMGPGSGGTVKSSGPC